MIETYRPVTWDIALSTADQTAW